MELNFSSTFKRPLSLYSFNPSYLIPSINHCCLLASCSCSAPMSLLLLLRSNPMSGSFFFILLHSSFFLLCFSNPMSNFFFLFSYFPLSSSSFQLCDFFDAFLSHSSLSLPFSISLAISLVSLSLRVVDQKRSYTPFSPVSAIFSLCL